MKQIMIMSHSIFAEGIKSACEDMLGPQNDIITIGFTNNAEFEKTISDKLDKIPEEDELIIWQYERNSLYGRHRIVEKEEYLKEKSVTDWNQSASS